MSLLDDVSIVVTPNGYKAGELYAVVPVPTEGAELVTNGDFSSDASWTKGTGWTISGGTATCDGTQTGNSNLYQAPFYVAGKRYKTKLTVNSISGTLKVFTGTAVQVLTITSAGDYEVIALSSSTTLYLQSTASTTVEIDNVSVKEYTAADMDVTRATAATRVDEAGLVNYAEIIGSEEVTNGDFATDLSGWTTNGVGATFSPLLFTNTANNGQIRQDFTTVVGVVYKLSIEITSGSWSVYASTSTSSGGSLGNITATGELIFTATTTTTYILCYLLGASGTEGVIDNISVKEVTRDNVPRIDYSGGGCPHILAEPQRTNLVTYSEDFSQWEVYRGTVTASAILSPDGGTNAYKYVEDSQTGSHMIRKQSLSVTDTEYYTASVFVKKAELSSVTLNSNSTARWLAGATFDIENGLVSSISNGTAEIISFNSDWYRCILSGVATSTTTSAGLEIATSSGAGTNGSGIYVFGAQFEQGSYATSYIPTSGSTVTRNQDIFTRDGIGSLINSEEGVLFVEMAALADDLTYRELSLSDGTNTNRIEIRFSNSSNRIQALLRSSGGVIVLTYNSATIIDFNKIAFKWKSGDFALWINGIEVGVNTTSISVLGLNRLALDGGSGGEILFAKVKQLQVYKTALTDEQLLQLTGESGTDFYESYAAMASALTYTIQ